MVEGIKRRRKKTPSHSFHHRLNNMTRYLLLLGLVFLASFAVVRADHEEGHHEEDDHHAEPTPNPEILKLFSEATAVVKECKETFHVSPENLGHYYATGLLKNDSDEAALCFANCILEKMKVITDGVFNPAGAKELIQTRFLKLFSSKPLDPEEVDKVVHDCTEGHGKDTTCESHYNLWACIYKALRKDDSLLKLQAEHH